uniref:Biotin carboxyl carrier protein of acetyl-CoA carboxylase n=1 Tax=Chondria tumulosa TaxID=2740715 RepID=A0A896SUE7_9FLOR|nr:acetyl-CoA carboxylase, biotin carboxyl carrier protein [Chondria tumulosa]QSD57134.1 acetyl-CoA carboxylase, biotin carboxyl carrier protein [Chondria tumulosa]
MQSLNNIIELIYSIKNNDIKKVKVKQEKKTILINKIRKKDINYCIKQNQNKQQINSKKVDKTKKAINNPTNLSKNTNEQSTTYSIIISPMVGNFYKSPAPNEPAFVELNEIIKPKQTVCIIEAMKLMNEIESEVEGEVVEILVKDGEIVDCGQALMKVKLN